MLTGDEDASLIEALRGSLKFPRLVIAIVYKNVLGACFNFEWTFEIHLGRLENQKTISV
jgi:hypothetical protein